ncbi:MAG: carbon-nitrogen hydrolase family protein [Planctomycetes bacterium]|nr:carbon-nitrogen hydrolase family protein [Planctomycetota bacterium]
MNVRVSVHQMNPRRGDVDANLEAILEALAGAPGSLAVFPECALTGYAFESKEEALAAAESVPGPSTDTLLEACRDHDVWAVVGLLERDGDRLFNAAAVLGPEGVEGVYRKMHLPYLGVDRFADPGDLGFPVFRLPFGTIGVLICYDLSFPEAARVLKLDGAQAICVPTNWPEAASVSCDFSPIVRAQENHVHVLTANRVGEEGGFRFLGRSRICDFQGRVLAEAGGEPAVFTAEIDFAAADHNRVVNVPGRYELDRIAHRRPEFYARLATS